MALLGDVLSVWRLAMVMKILKVSGCQRQGNNGDIVVEECYIPPNQDEGDEIVYMYYRGEML